MPAELAEPSGLRERGKARRRAAIIRAALRLFADQGFEATTVAEIARDAEVAPRTVSLYFPTKQEIALGRLNDTADGLAQALQRRAPGESAVGVISAWLRARNAEPDPEGLRQLSERMLYANPDLRALRTARIASAIDAAKRAISKDIGVPEDDIRARIAAAAVGAVMLEVADDPASLHDDTAIDAAADFIQAGLAALTSGVIRSRTH